ncbi:hypothetical protein [Bacteroides oleiciplenus]|uniref:hypothetical protein n=1 Tax=Bacteroides oleiciplenus TaxID=626931 RepID=UPI0011C1127F|nr:hypothetical protein [Bacteroides oleiciplenus]
MKRKYLFLILLSTVCVSCSNVKEKDPKRALLDSIREADSIAAVEEAAEAAFEAVREEYQYHTLDGKGTQKEYQGSLEQKEHLDMIDKKMEEDPNF